MRALRILLIITSAGGIAFMFYVLATTPKRDNEGFWVAIGVAIWLSLNLLYLLKGSSNIGSSRLSRLGSLWLDAKERELRERADKPPQSN